jgi:hypothetical protein
MDPTVQVRSLLLRRVKAELRAAVDALLLLVPPLAVSHGGADCRPVTSSMCTKPEADGWRAL